MPNLNRLQQITEAEYIAGLPSRANLATVYRDNADTDGHCYQMNVRAVGGLAITFPFRFIEVGSSHGGGFNSLIEVDEPLNDAHLGAAEAAGFRLLGSFQIGQSENFWYPTKEYKVNGQPFERGYVIDFIGDALTKLTLAQENYVH